MEPTEERRDIPHVKWPGRTIRCNNCGRAFFEDETIPGETCNCWSTAVAPDEDNLMLVPDGCMAVAQEKQE